MKRACAHTRIHTHTYTHTHTHKHIHTLTHTHTQTHTHTHAHTHTHTATHTHIQTLYCVFEKWVLRDCRKEEVECGADVKRETVPCDGANV